MTIESVKTYNVPIKGYISSHIEVEASSKTEAMKTAKEQVSKRNFNHLVTWDFLTTTNNIVEKKEEQDICDFVISSLNELEDRSLALLPTDEAEQLYFTLLHSVIIRLLGVGWKMECLSWEINDLLHDHMNFLKNESENQAA